MTALDTNILVRYAVKDDRRQAALATEFMMNNRCLVMKTVLLELAWVLSSSSGYGLPRKVVAERLRHILGLPTIETEDAVKVAQAIAWYEQGMDFADALHLASAEELAGFATMDGRLAGKAAKLGLPPKVLLLK